MVRSRQWLLAVAIVAAILIAARAALPSVAQRYVNSSLADMGGYYGQVADVDVSLIRGAYTLRDVTVVKRGVQAADPFLDMERMDISVQWQALLRGRLVGEIGMHAPVVNMIQGESDADTQLGAGVNWPAEVRELFPFQFNRVEVTDGLVTFRAPGIEAEQSLTLRDAQVLLHDLTNTQREDQDAFSDVELSGAVMGNAPLTLSGRFDPNAELPTFDVDLTLENAQLVDVNPWLEQFLNVDAERGAFSMYTEIAAADGRFEGYIKPIMQDPQILSAEEPSEGPFQKAWEALVGVAVKIFENKETGQVATQIPFSGELENPQTELIPAMVNLLRNAFVAAFSHSLEGTVSLRDVDPDADVNPAREED